MAFSMSSQNNVVLADDGLGDGSLKMVTIYDDGSRILIQTRARTVREVLTAAQITINDFDKIEPELDDLIDTDEFVINVYRAQPVLVRDGIKRVKAMSGARDARGIALSLGLVISEYDKVYFRDLSSSESLEAGLSQEVVVERREAKNANRPTIMEKITSGEITSATPPPGTDKMAGLDLGECTVGSANNEACVWQFLRSQGFSMTATAGVMGNLQQEHRFRTDGDGLAQWTGGRKTRLYTMPNPTWLSTQLEFLMSELNGGYAHVRDALLTSTTIEAAVQIFQNQFEKCGICREDLRIKYAYEIYGKYVE